MNCNAPQSILFVCLGNICRSPLAEGVFRHIVDARGASGHFRIDSAATGEWNIGKPPDPRTIAVARRHGIDVSDLRVRQVVPADFGRFDIILGMDGSNIDDLGVIAPFGSCTTVARFHDFATGEPADVPDPYFGGDEAFETAYRMIWAAANSLYDRLAGADRGVSG